MNELTIKHRAAAVRKSWNYTEQLQRALAAQQRCQRLFQQLGLISPAPQLAYAHRPAGVRSNRRSG